MRSESFVFPPADSGRGAVWLARLTGGQEVAGSSPVAPTGWKCWIGKGVGYPPTFGDACGNRRENGCGERRWPCASLVEAMHGPSGRWARALFLRRRCDVNPRCRSGGTASIPSGRVPSSPVTEVTRLGQEFLPATGFRPAPPTREPGWPCRRRAARFDAPACLRHRDRKRWVLSRSRMHAPKGKTWGKKPAAATPSIGKDSEAGATPLSRACYGAGSCRFRGDVGRAMSSG